MKTTAQIAAELQGCDPQAMRVADVNRFLEQLVEPVPQSEPLALRDALGRVLAHDLVSPISVPPHDNSAMDGFAFDGSQLRAGQALVLRLCGTALAGKAWRGRVAAGECLKITTGAVMPGALDTVVPLEFVQARGDVIEIPADVVRAGDNRRLLGEDLLAGQAALRRGQLLGPAALGLIASLGLGTVSVRRRVKVAYFSTGDEILSLGQAPRAGAVFDSNRYTVCGLLQRLGVEVIDLGVVADSPTLLQAAFHQAAACADAVITSGGVSVGEADHTRSMLRQLGDMAFWRVAMRPGRPLAVGRISSATDHGGAGTLVFGLPGNPVAVMVTFLVFVRPALLRLMGCSTVEPVLLKAHSLEPLRKKPGRTEYQRGIVGQSADARLSVRVTGNQGSGVLHSMVQANGLIVLHHDQSDVAAGDEVDVMMFDGVV